MNTDLDKIESEVNEKLSLVKDQQELEALRIGYLGRKGAITEVLKSLSGLSLDERKALGEKANNLKKQIEALLDAKKAELLKASIESELGTEKVELSPLFAYPFPYGHSHPLTQLIDEMTDIFRSLGFDTARGPEIETDWYNFEALNIPKDHPARDSQDTFYLSTAGKLLLRTHTSPTQIHVMEKRKPPIRVIVPGRVYRNEATDASHSAFFHQIEGLAVDQRITFSDLKGVLTIFIHKLFGKNVNLRFRPSHFQFTEPSAEVDIQCIICGGKGCRSCKFSGWMEMLGAGMVHPNVFKAVNYDAEKYTGFAFGIGVERFAMQIYRVDDMRLFFENNLQFLSKF
jgi:phenylalanyl-tRNA synthetase alpha chain